MTQWGFNGSVIFDHCWVFVYSISYQTRSGLSSEIYRSKLFFVECNQLWNCMSYSKQKLEFQ